jgi:hypothetical protein
MTTETVHPSPRRSWYVISIWAERQPDRPPVWRGSVETVEGERMYFTTLVELNQLLITIGGWTDSEPAPLEAMDRRGG